MSIHLIFEPYEKLAYKDILFFAACTGMVLQVVHIAMDSSLMPSRPYLLAICN